MLRYLVVKITNKCDDWQCNINSVSVDGAKAGIGRFVFLRYHLKYSILTDLVKHDAMLAHVETNLSLL